MRRKRTFGKAGGHVQCIYSPFPTKKSFKIKELVHLKKGWLEDFFIIMIGYGDGMAPGNLSDISLFLVVGKKIFRLSIVAGFVSSQKCR